MAHVTSLCTFAHARRWRGSRWSVTVRDQILARLKQGWSPEHGPGDGQAGHLPRDHLPVPWRGRRTTPGVSTCPSASRNVGGGVVSSLSAALAERPQEANDRQTPGHWEADLMRSGPYPDRETPISRPTPKGRTRPVLFHRREQHPRKAPQRTLLSDVQAISPQNTVEIFLNHVLHLKNPHSASAGMVRRTITRTGRRLSADRRQR